MAPRRGVLAALALLALVCIGAPAVAQDFGFAGTYHVRGVASEPTLGGIGVTGSLSLNSAGGLAAPSSITFQRLNDDAVLDIATVTLAKDAAGRINGALSGSSTTVVLNGTFFDKTAASSIFATFSYSNTSTLTTGVGIAELVKDTTTTFSQGDLTGTWRVKLLEGEELAGGDPGSLADVETAFGSLVVGPTGNVTGGSLFFPRSGASQSIVGGTVLIDANGVITGEVLTSSGLSTDFHSVMSSDKQMIASVTQRPGDEETVFRGLAFLGRTPTVTYAGSDRAGQWDFFGLELLADGADVGNMLTGTLNIDAGGIVTSGSLRGLDGLTLDVTGSFTLTTGGAPSGQGFMAGDLMVGGMPVQLDAVMLPTKRQIMGVSDAAVGEFARTLGIFKMIKAGAAPPSVQFASGNVSVTEGTASAMVTLTRTGTLTSPSTVRFFTTPLSAIPGVDYTNTSIFVSFAANVATRTVTVPILNDQLLDGPRTVMLGLDTPTGAVIGEPSTAVLTIADNDQPGVVKLSAGTYAAKEPTGTAPSTLVVTIVRMPATPGGSLGGNVSVGYTTTDGTAHAGADYTAAAGSVTFQKGETSKTVSIPILKDTLAEGTETFTFTLSNPTGGGTLLAPPAAVLGSPSSAVISIADAQQAGVIKLESATYTVNEASGSLLVKILRSGGNLGGNVSVDFATANGTALAGTDYTATSGTAVFGAGNTSVTVAIPILQDLFPDGDKAFTFALSNPTNGAMLAKPSTASIKILDDESAFQFQLGTFVAKENGKTAPITILRTGALITGANVSFSTTNGSAVAGRDFTPTSTVVKFVPKQKSAIVTVPLLDDAIFLGNRSVGLQLTNPGGGALLGTPSTATLLILDDEQPGVFKLSAATYTTTEAAGSVAVTIQRTGTNLAANVSVSFSTGNGSALSGLDYTATAGTLTFGKGETSRIVKVPILQDTLAEGVETFTFALGSPTSGATLGSPSAAGIAIADDDSAGVFSLTAATYGVNENAGSLSVRILRTGGKLAGNVSVSYATGNGSATAGLDYTATLGTVTFGPGQTQADVTIPILQDTLGEGDETFVFTLSNPSSGATLGKPASALVTIFDDESAFQFVAGEFVVKEAKGNAGITILRTGALLTSANVSFTTTNGSAVAGRDFAPTSALVKFVPRQKSAVVSVPIFPVATFLGNRSVGLQLTNPTGGAQLGTPSSSLLTIADDQNPGVIRLSASAYGVGEGAGSVSVLIQRTPSVAGATLSGNVTVAFATANGSALSGLDYTARAGTVTFGPGETSKIVSIPILDDNVAEGSETFSFALSPPTGGAALGTPSSATITIKDDEQLSIVRLGAAAYRVVEGAGNLGITVVRSGGTASNVSVMFETVAGTASPSSEGGDYLHTQGMLTFTAGQTSKTVTIPIVQDTLPEGDETFTVLLSNPSAGARLDTPSSALVTIEDDESLVQFSGKFIGDQPEVVRTGSLAANVSVQYMATGGTAIPGDDYILPPGTLVFPPGVARRSIPVFIVPDVIAEGPETLTLTLFDPTPPLQLGPDASKTFTVSDNDFGGNVGFGAASLTVTRGNTSQLAIIRDGGTGTILTVAVSVVGGTATPGVDFSLGNTSVTFMPGETTKLVPVTALATGGSLMPGPLTAPPAEVAPDRTVVFGISFPPGAAALGAITTATLTIQGAPATLQFGAAAYSITEQGEAATITIVRTGNLDSFVSVSYATSPGTATAGADYASASGTLTFGPFVSSLNFFVPIVNDGVAEGPETVNLVLGDVSAGAVLGPQATAVLTITDGVAAGTLELISRSTDGDAGNGASGRPVLDGTGARAVFESSATNFDVAGFGTSVFVHSRGEESATQLVSASMEGGAEDGNSGEAVISADGRFVAFSSTSTNLIDTDSNEKRDIYVRDLSSGAIERVSKTVAGGQTNGHSSEPAISGDGGVIAYTSVAANLRPAGTTSGVFVFDRVAGTTTLASRDASGGAFVSAVSPAISANGRFVAFVATDDPGGSGYQLYIRDLVLGVTELVSQASNGTPAQGASLARPALSADGRIVAFASPATNLGDPSGVGQIYVRDRQTGVTELASKSPTGAPGDGESDEPQLSADGRVLVFTSFAANLGPADPNDVSDVYARDLQTGVTLRLSVSGSIEPTGSSQAPALSGDGTFAVFETFANNLAPGDTNDVVDVVGRAVTFAAGPTQADIAVSKTVNVPNPAVGTAVTFTVTATNNGPAAATGVQVSDPLPAGFQFASASPSQGVYSTASGVWTVGSLTASGAGASATLQIAATVTPTGPYTNTATRTASSPTDPNPGNDSASVSVGPAAISLSTAGPLVGIGRNISGTVTLPAPAAGTVNVALSASPGGIVSLLPGNVSIASGQSTGTFTVTGVAAGTATITGSAAGLASGNVSVTATSSVSLGALPTLGPGQSQSLPISLSTPAPAGGVTVSFASGNTSVATVTSSVVIPAGSQVPAANPQVTGVGVGSTSINASAVGFAPDSRPATVVIGVTFTPSPFSVVVGTSKNVTVNLSAPAPSGGFTVGLATANASVATVASPVTVAAGQTSVQAAMTGVVIGSTTLQASGPGVTSTSVTINVTAPPPITIFSQTVGKDLQLFSSLTLGAAAPAGGAPVTVTSLDPSRVILAPSPTVAGNGSIVLTVPAGSISSSYYVQALAGAGSVGVTASAPGYLNGSATITLTPSGFIINNVGDFPTTTLSANQSIQIASGRLNTGSLTFAGNQDLRAGIAPVSVAVTATDQAGAGVGAITSSPVVFNAASGLASTSFDPIAAGTSRIEVVTPPGFNTSATFRSVIATVSAPTLFISNQIAGNNLQVTTPVFLGAPAPAGGLPLTLTSADPSKVVVSGSQTTAGNANGSTTVTVPAGSTIINVYFQGLAAAGSTTVTASAPGFQSGMATVDLAPSGFVIDFPSSFNTTTLSANTSVQVSPWRLAAGTLNLSTPQAVRGGLTVNVDVTATDQSGSGVGVITTSPLVFNGGDNVKLTAFDPMGAGTSRIEVVTPPGFNASASNRMITATVTAPAITVSNQLVGKNLQVSTSVFLGAPAPAGGLPVTLTSADPARMLLSVGQTAAGNGSIVVTVPAGSTTTPYYVQALDGSGTVTLGASAPGFQNGSATITLAPSAFIINSPTSISTTTFSGNTSVQIISARLNSPALTFSTNQEVRGGIAPVPVFVTATNQTGGPTVGTITTSPLVFNGGDDSKQTAFDPAVAGTSLIQVVTPSGFNTSANFTAITATVSAPAIVFSPSSILVGRDLQTQVSVLLEAAPPSPVTVTLTVGSTAVATITTDGTVAGSNTVTFTNVTTQIVGNVFVQGRDSSVSTTITAQAPGFADGVANVTTQPSGFIIPTGDFSIAAGDANRTLTIQAARLDPTTLNFVQNQQVRGGVTVNVPVTAQDVSGTGVGTITTSPVTFTGGVLSANTQFDPAVVGTSRVTAGVPPGFDTPSNSRQITVTVTP